MPTKEKVKATFRSPFSPRCPTTTKNVSLSFSVVTGEAAQQPPPAKKIKTTTTDNDANDALLVASAAAVTAPRCSLCQRFLVVRDGVDEKCAQCRSALDGHLPYCRACDTSDRYPP